jgi:Uma2 family endonuclease
MKRPRASTLPRAIQEVEYEEAAQAYLRSLPLEHFMEATGQATQRKISWDSLDLLSTRHPEVKVFNELLVQYPLAGRRRFGQVVPDNMVVLTDQPIRASSSYNVPLEPARPFWVLEYVSKSNKRKDYKDSFKKYERHLKVPYYLIFHPDDQKLTLYRHRGEKYRAVPPNKEGRYPIPKLDLEVGVLDGWVRFWYQGQLLPLPADLQRQADEEKRRADELAQRADAETRRADELAQRADAETRRADELAQRADAETRRADELAQRAATEAAARQALERELARLRAQLEQSSPKAADHPD